MRWLLCAGGCHGKLPGPNIRSYISGRKFQRGHAIVPYDLPSFIHMMKPRVLSRPSPPESSALSRAFLWKYQTLSLGLKWWRCLAQQFLLLNTDAVEKFWPLILKVSSVVVYTVFISSRSWEWYSASKRLIALPSISLCVDKPSRVVSTQLCATLVNKNIQASACYVKTIRPILLWWVRTWIPNQRVPSMVLFYAIYTWSPRSLALHAL